MNEYHLEVLMRRALLRGNGWVSATGRRLRAFRWPALYGLRLLR